MKKEEFIQFVAKNIKYHLPSEFKDFKIEVGKHMGLVISEKKSPNTIKIYLVNHMKNLWRTKIYFQSWKLLQITLRRGGILLGKLETKKDRR